MTAALVLAMSVTTFPSVLPASCAKTSRMARIGAPMTMTSAMSTTLVSALALATMPRSSALRSVIESVSLPTTTISGRASFRARANDEPMRPSPTTATVVIELRQLLGHRIQQAPQVGHQQVEVLEVERLGAVRQRLVGRRVHFHDQAVSAGGYRRERHRPHERPAACRLRGIDDDREV